ncbi:MAG: M23 family metallopeptidase [Elusimicrobia bacterium]|nr:M23 family metallopeptidase [Elusimicrobiota bacterium]
MTAAVLLALAAPLRAQGRQKRELARIQSELRNTRDQLQRLRAQESSLEGDVGRLQGLDARSRRRVDRLRRSIREAEARRAELKSRLESAGRVGEFWTAALESETVRLAAAESGRSDFYGSGGLWAEEFRRTAILEKARHLRGLEGFQRRTEEAAAAARRRASELAASRRRAQADQDARRAEYEAKKARLAQAQSQVAAAARKAQELEDSAKALTALISKIGSRHFWRRTGTQAKLDRPRHSLPWPAPGRVVTAFGRERDPELGTWIVRQGVTLATAPSAPVDAIASGRVIFAGPFRSYGNVLIVDHGGGFFSVYGSLGELDAAKGDRVGPGEAIARAGTGSSGGGRVYLEIRRGTKALDPMAWLQKR